MSAPKTVYKVQAKNSVYIDFCCCQKHFFLIQLIRSKPKEVLQ